MTSQGAPDSGRDAAASAVRRARGLTIRIRWLVLIDVATIVGAMVLAFFFRVDFSRVGWESLVPRWPMIAIAVVVRLPLYFLYRVYAPLWRYAGTREVLRIAQATAIGSLLMILVNIALLPRIGVPTLHTYSFFLLDWMLNVGAMCATRLAARTVLEWLLAHHKKTVLDVLAPHRTVLIAGAGEVGSTVARMIRGNPETGLRLVGFIDDDPTKQGAQIRGVPVLGTRNDIARLAARHAVDEVIVAMSRAPAAVIQDIRESCASNNLTVRVMPTVYDLMFGTFTVDQVREWRAVEILPTRERAAQGPADRQTYSSLMVTGGAGFIGANFVRYMLDEHPGYRIVVYDKLTYAGNLDNLLDLVESYGDRYVFLRGDICDHEHVCRAIEKHAVDGIVNFAAESHVDRSLLNPRSFLDTNVYGTYALLEAARRLGVRRFHQVSTDEVYGQVIHGSFSEQDRMETRSPYSASKAGADLLCQAYHASFKVPITITRGSNNIGPYQYPEKVVPLFITNALDNQSLPIYGDGHYVRDYQHVLDHCRGIDLVLHKGIVGEVYNCGGGNEVTSNEVARKILDALDRPYSLIAHVEDRPGQDRRYSLDCAKIKALGWRPAYDFDRALGVTIDWYLKNEWWWRKIKSGEYRKYYEDQFKVRLEKAVEASLMDDPQG